MPRRGMLIMTDGTPHDWFNNGKKFSLHMTLDDTTGEILSEWFTPTKYQLGYYYAFKIMFGKYDVPQVVYSDGTTILCDPKEEETEFVPLDDTDLTKIMCLKEERNILNGNMISYNNHYYIPINDDRTDYIFYKDIKVEVWKDIFDSNIIRISKNKKIYKTRLIEGHRIDPEKRK